MTDRPFLLDLSRLVWRAWSGRLPTGIDRVCLAYLDHFAPRAQAIVKRGEQRLVLSAAQSDALFALLRSGGKGLRPALALLLTRASLTQYGRKRRLAGKTYLNIGHTGLDAPGLPRWLKAVGLTPIFLIHDLIPITHPEFCRDGENARHVVRMRQALAATAGIIANSASTRDALADFAAAQGLPMPPSLVAWLAADKHGDPAILPPPMRPYFLMIGTIEARKNHLLLLHLWEHLIAASGDATPELVLIGQRGWEADDVFALLDRSPRLKRHVRELGRCDDATMLAMLDGARALLMPSFIEGFGIPVIEALQRGVPVIASDLPVFREIAGDIPLYLDPLDGQGWESAIRDFMGTNPDCPARTRQLALAPAYRPPSWTTHFTRVEAWLESLPRA
jgi:glycosyltransferase involved in cell wall biosynthesis